MAPLNPHGNTTMTWGPKDARNTYHIPQWSSHYVDVLDNGNLAVFPTRNAEGPYIDLYQLAQEIQQVGLQLPVLIRFKDVLRDRVTQLIEAFDSAIERQSYTGGYTAVYPIKVNQHHTVIQTLVEKMDLRVGLEAGSKAELIANLCVAPPKSTLICNGYKDREYIRLALFGRSMGHPIYIVVEKPSEILDVIAESKALGVQPLIGIRARLSSVGQGKWQNTGGEKSKFGLTSSQILTAIEQLKKADLLDCVQLLHVHLGSQIPNIRDIREGIREATQIYSQLKAMDVPLSTMDLGGGLGIDYEGTHSRSFCSTNYSVNDYAQTIVTTIAEVCQLRDCPQPDIITESGRAMVAHHAIILSNVIDYDSNRQLRPDAESQAGEFGSLATLKTIYRELDNIAAPEAFFEAKTLIDEVHAAFNNGVIDLQARAQAEQLYLSVCQRLQVRLRSESHVERQIGEALNTKLAEKYFCNLSFFQSLPDVWAIDQIFPIVPIHRLDEKPDHRAVLHDLTCDSDGCIKHYVDEFGIGESLPVHAMNDKEYVLGFFLIGAYQEILGDMHNLFGDTDSVCVSLKSDGSYTLDEARPGDTIESLLNYVHFDKSTLFAELGRKLGGSGLSADEQTRLIKTIEEVIGKHSYLQD